MIGLAVKVGVAVVATNIVDVVPPRLLLVLAQTRKVDAKVLRHVLSHAKRDFHDVSHKRAQKADGPEQQGVAKLVFGQTLPSNVLDVGAVIEVKILGELRGCGFTGKAAVA